MTLQKKSHKLATSICQTLFDAGYTAYFAGGWVRDLLQGKESDEIDIATSASPEAVQKLFAKTIPVGVAFGVIIVVLDNCHFEVTTFRKDHPSHDGRHPDGVDFSTPEKDAKRRDFTVNGMFLDPLTDTLYDYVNGQADLKAGIIRAIGNPQQRFEEDRLRMIRAVRFAARLSFRIEEETENAIQAQADTLFPSVSMERIWQELNKMAPYPHFDNALMRLHRYGLLPAIFPQLKGVSIEELEQRLIPFPYFPPECPTIVYLRELFPKMSSEEQVALCDYLKATGEDKKLVMYLTQTADKMQNEELDLYDWAHIYAHPYNELLIQVEGAKILPPDRAPFFEAHTKRKKILKRAIERIQRNKPLVTSRHLKQLGIEPGVQMGVLLKEAERIAINENFTSAEEVLDRLKLS